MRADKQEDWRLLYMILDKIKTLDDAINEATIQMIANKEDLK